MRDCKVVDRLGQVLQFIARGARRLAVFVVGMVVVVVGLILVPLPGPGWAIVFVGLAILATEFTWAEIVLKRAKQQVTKFASKLRSNKQADPEPSPPPSPPPAPAISIRRTEPAQLTPDNPS